MSAGLPSSALLVIAAYFAGSEIRVVAAAARMLALLRIAQHRPGGVVHLQIAAAGVVERADRLAIRHGDVVEIGVELRIDSSCRSRPRPWRKCSVLGAGIVIFGVTLVCAFRYLKCSTCG